jgi:hypothetical protein
MATPRSEGSFLVALPMELLQRIAVDLDDDHDAILCTRLTCKTLEAAKFDCFAKKFFDSHEYCILYWVSLLRLYALLASSSRLTTKMRTVTLSSCFFSNLSFKHVQLSLNQGQTDMKSAQIAAMNAYSKGQVEMLQTQLLPDTELIRDVLVALRAKCPGVELNVDIRKNATSSILVHAKVLVAVAVLCTPLTGLTVDPTTLNSGELETMQSGLSACASSLVRFYFGDTNVTEAEATSRLLVGRRSSLLRSVLGSANALRHLKLNLHHNRTRCGMEGLTSELLLTSPYPMLQSLTLASLAVTEETMLNALANWGGQLVKVDFRVVHLTDIEGEGWSDVFRTLAVLPQLCDVTFSALHGRRNAADHIFVDLRNLKHGQTTFFQVSTLRTHNNVVFCKDELAAGLQELLEGGLKYC